MFAISQSAALSEAFCLQVTAWCESNPKMHIFGMLLYTDSDPIARGLSCAFAGSKLGEQVMTHYEPNLEVIVDHVSAAITYVLKTLTTPMTLTRNRPVSTSSLGRSRTPKPFPSSNTSSSWLTASIPSRQSRPKATKLRARRPK